jgi:hypothetical protein
MHLNLLPAVWGKKEEKIPKILPTDLQGFSGRVVQALMQTGAEALVERDTLC